MCDKELLVGYIYGELDGFERQEFEKHLTACAECREEVAGLRGTRAYLQSWQPPAPDLGFEITRSRVVSTRRRFQVPPVWGLAAAAVLVLAVAAAIANVEVRAGRDGFVVRTGWQQIQPDGAAVPVTTPAAASDASSLEEMERRIVQIESALAARDARQDAAIPAAAGDGAARLSEAELLRRVRQVIRDSETRQQRELATRIAQVTRELDILHRSDLARLQQTFAESQRLTDAEVLQQRERMNQMYRLVATQR